MSTKPAKQSPLDRAVALQQKGDLGGAEAAYREALKKDPGNPNASVLFGVLLHKTGRAGEAVPRIERGIAESRKRGGQPDPNWMIALSFARRDAGDIEGALAEMDGLVRLAPGTPELFLLRAQLLQRLDRHEEAISDYERYLKQRPDDAKAINNLGFSLERTGRLAEALTAYDKAVKADPKYTHAIGNMGRLLLDIGQPEAAIQNLRRAYALDPGNRTAECALIDALSVGEHPEEAERLAEAAYAARPDDLSALVQLGNARMVMGRRTAAAELARRGREIDPGSPAVLGLLAEADKEASEAELLLAIESVLGDEIEVQQEIALHFAAARLSEKLKRYPQAFDHYSAGNSRRRSVLESFDDAYDRAAVEARIDSLIAAFPKEKMTGAGGNASELPVFIVGMPRSGTSLTEQILASHPKAVGAGELGEVRQIVTWMRNLHGYPDVLQVNILTKVAGGYLQKVGKFGRGAARVTDKMPGNYVHLGLIARMFPKARIVHCRRDPVDNCLSCFAQNFRADALAWSTDLGDLGHQYCQYRRLMDHWRSVLPAGRMLEVDYEDTVADLEGQARRLVEFVGLDWDPACLDFHKTERAVTTASREQVRNPIYRSSVGRWKRYGDGVAPLIEALTACGCGPSAR